jgi:hypothetical protein
MSATAMVYDHENSMRSGNFSGVDDRQTIMPAVHVTKCRLTLEKERDAFFTQTTIGVTGDNVTAVASENLSDVPSPTAVVTNSGALFVKDALVHISLSTPEPGGRWENSYRSFAISAARRTQRVP